MDHLELEELKKRVGELERLTWSVFRALETYVTFNAPPEEESSRKEEEKTQNP